MSRPYGDLQVGLYSPLPQSPEGFRCILYCYSNELQRIMLVSCADPQPEKWGQMVSKWVEEYGSPTELIYDSTTVEERELAVIRQAAKCQATRPLDLSHFRMLLDQSIRYLRERHGSETTWSGHLPLIHQILDALCYDQVWSWMYVDSNLSSRNV